MEKVHCLWIGGPLSTMEKMALQSHLNVGHECHLWVYDRVEGVPEGILIEDGNEILPAEEIFFYQVGEGKGSVSAFSNLFRYTLIFQIGGWWCDTDVVCLRPFIFDNEYVLATERPDEKKTYSQITTCAFKCPPKSDLMKYCLDIVQKKDRSKLEWGEIGPLLFSEAAIMTGKSSFASSVETFCPIHWFDVPKFVTEDVPTPNSTAVHFWNEVWRRQSIDKDAEYNPHCLYEKLKNVVLSNSQRSHRTLPFTEIH